MDRSNFKVPHILLFADCVATKVITYFNIASQTTSLPIGLSHFHNINIKTN